MHLRPELLDHVLALKIPNLDGWASGSAQPVAVGRKAKRVDCVGVIQSVQMFAIIEIPQHGFGILTTRSTQRTIGRHGYSVKITRVSNVVGLQFTISQIPYLEY